MYVCFFPEVSVLKIFEEAKAVEDSSARCAVDVDLDNGLEETTKKEDTKKQPNIQHNPLQVILQKELPADKVDVWSEMVDRTYRAHITLLTEPGNATELKDKVMATDAFKIRGVSGASYVGFFYCFASSAESTTSPHKRSAPFQDAHASKLIHSMLEARLGSDERSIAHGDMYFLNDNGKFGLMNKFMGLFKWAGDTVDGERKVALSVRRKHIMVAYNEASARSRRRNTRSFTGLKHMENLFVFTKSDIDLPSKSKKHFTGTNQGETFENVHLPALSGLWSSEVKTKKLIYGLRRFRPGGPGDDEDQ